MTVRLSVATIFKSLADETRLSIVRKLVTDGCDVSGSDIVSSCAEFHKLSQPAMSHHFQKLVSAGVLSERKVGVEKFYRLNTQLLENGGIDPKKL